MITGAQIRMARGYLRWSVKELSDACGVSAATIERMEEAEGLPKSFADSLAKIQASFELAGLQFIPENGGGAGVRLRKRMAPPDEGIRPSQLTSENDA
jgi:transcriptional regulator with XRE-family HTH domain